MEKFWDIDLFSIPQYDLTVGYHFNDKHNIGFEIGWNHLMYVMTDWQNVHMKGQIRGTPVERVAAASLVMCHF